jgi:hypothetical protein
MVFSLVASAGRVSDLLLCTSRSVAKCRCCGHSELNQRRIRQFEIVRTMRRERGAS